MSLTRKNAFVKIKFPMAADAVIARDGWVCINEGGFAVPGADTAGLKFVGVAAQGMDNTGGTDGGMRIYVYVMGQFKRTMAGLVSGDLGSPVYATGAASCDKTSSNNIGVGTITQVVSATLAWIYVQQVEVIQVQGQGQSDIVAKQDPYTITRADNWSAVTSACELAYGMAIAYGAHIEDANIHDTADMDNGLGVVNAPTDLASMLALVNLLTTKYSAHEADAAKNSAWAYHHAKEAQTHALQAVTEVTTLIGALARINDIKVAFNTHDADNTAHNETDPTHQCNTSNAAWGAIVRFAVRGVAATDEVFVTVRTAGVSGAILDGTSVFVDTGLIGMIFDKDPGTDTEIGYVVLKGQPA